MENNHPRILYFFPENPLLKNAGNKTRVLSLLEYFKSKKIKVDFVSDDSIDKNIEEVKELIKYGLAENVNILKRKPKKDNLIKYVINYKIKKLLYRKKGFYNRSNFYRKKQFNILLSKNRYDYIIISYITNFSLIDRKMAKGAKIVIDTHDFLTANFQNDKNFSLGNCFQEEIEILNKADEIWAISNDEYYVFSQFCRNRVKLIPFWVKDNISEELYFSEKEFDLIYVASDNPHNVKASQWFFTQVYPILPSSIKICVIGKITNYIKEYDNVTSFKFVENLTEYYKKSKLAICPMLTGTGVKVKVIEALSFGLPIVCNLRGVDGLSNKTNNGCLITNNEKEFAEYIMKLLNNPYFYQKHQNEAIEYFKNNYSEEIGYKNLDSIFSQSLF